MKLIKLFSIALVLIMTVGFQNQAQAQIIDSLPYFKMELLVFGDDDRIFGGTFEMPKSMKSSMKTISFSMDNMKKEGTSRPVVRTSDRPIILKRNGDCYKIGCVKDKNCTACTLYWWDRNGDGKVQPRKEIRCGCSDGKTSCRVRIEKVPCK